MTSTTLEMECDPCKVHDGVDLFISIVCRVETGYMKIQCGSSGNAGGLRLRLNEINW